MKSGCNIIFWTCNNIITASSLFVACSQKKSIAWSFGSFGISLVLFLVFTHLLSACTSDLFASTVSHTFSFL
jgi:hypothetical protein